MNTDVKDLAKLIRIKNPMAAWAIIAFAVALILFMVVLVSLLRNVLQWVQLRADYQASADAIAQVQDLQAANPDTLRMQITTARQAIEDELLDFPTPKLAADELARYYQYANQQNTQLTRMEALLNTPEEEAQSAYKVQRFSLEVQGDMANLLQFLGRIGNGAYPSFMLENIAVYPVDAVSASVANADLTVYSSEYAPGGAETVTDASSPTPATSDGDGESLASPGQQTARATD